MGVASESYRVKSKECVTSESWVVHFSLIADGNCDSFFDPRPVFFHPIFT